MKNFNRPILGILWSIVFLFAACKNEPPKVENEEETITTLELVFTPVNGGKSVKFKYQDLDGDGANPPIYTTDFLDSNTTYNTQITLLNESSNPVVNITDEVKAEGVDHQFFYLSEPSNLAAIQYNDKDANDYPIGIQTVFQMLKKGDGKLKIILRHKPNKKGSNVSAGDVANAGGETDIEVQFDLKIR